MTTAPPKPCPRPGCSARTTGGPCPEHQREYERGRGSAAKRLYDARWRRESRAFLAANPFCVDCEAEGRTTLAKETDHEIPHRGDPEIFWDRTNWRPRCKTCHSRKTAREGRWG